MPTGKASFQKNVHNLAKITNVRDRLHNLGNFSSIENIYVTNHKGKK